ncbi:hypothetical protein EPN90_00225 [Patescibacteria group bacterium]|nr:MAG: hypothetical protein EPN90_00225 [Patescibacteria group bacterium]
MFFSLLFSFLIFGTVALLERTFFAAVWGGSPASDSVLALAAALAVSLPNRLALIWIFSAAVASEMFSNFLPGAAALALFVGVAASRFLLDVVFSHRSPISRAACAALGVLTALFTITLFRSAGVIFSGSMTYAALGAIWQGALLVAIFTSAAAVILLLVLQLFRRLLGGVIKTV